MHFRWAAAMVLLLGSMASTASAAAMRGPSEDLAAEVNTFIGTQDEGNTFPGASAPFGLIQVSPVGAHYAGWRYDDDRIRGFGHSFLSGAGCWEQGGLVTVLPVTGRTVTCPPCSQHPAPERKECPKPRIFVSS